MKKYKTHEWVYLGRTGHIERTIWTDGNKKYIKWCGQFIEVVEYNSLMANWKATENY